MVDDVLVGLVVVVVEDLFAESRRRAHCSREAHVEAEVCKLRVHVVDGRDYNSEVGGATAREELGSVIEELAAR